MDMLIFLFVTIIAVAWLFWGDINFTKNLEAEPSFIILIKGDDIRAIDIINNSQSNEFIEHLIKSGYEKKEVILAKNQEDAIEKYRVMTELTPLEIANSTIRSANIRISELKLEIQSKNEIIYKLESRLAKNSSTSDISDLDILGFTTKPEIKDLKERYNRLVQLYHPDKGGSHVMMVRINSAYKIYLSRAKEHD